MEIYRISEKFEQPITTIVTGSAIPTKKPERKAFIAKILGDGFGNILYSNGPDEAEKTAMALYRIINSRKTSDEDISNSVNSLREFVHEEYNLIKCLKKGIGYHYGAMPDIAKTAVEDLFKWGKISYVACTSTLLEGVNLPAKNIFIENPKLGLEPMDDSSFWNLAGRAGRLMKDLSGNVYCINQDKWDKPVTERSKEYEIGSAMDRTVNLSSFNTYCEHINFELPKKPDIELPKKEQAFNNLVVRYKQDGEGETLDFIMRRSSRNIALDLIKKIADASNAITLPLDLLRRNKSIDFRRQQRFFEYLTHLSEDSLKEIVPRQPFAPNFYEFLITAYRIIEEYFATEKRGEMYKYFANISNRWIKEEPLHDMILEAVDFKKRRQKMKVDINEIIRELIKDLNDDIRFFYVKTSKCYCDLLSFEFERRKINLDDYYYKDFGLPNYLELGMHKSGTILLHNIGLSRTTSIVVNNICQSHELDSDEMFSWLNDNSTFIARQLKRPLRVEFLGYFGDNGNF